ncbi:MAG: UTP--glucose-1-phosphate uridylyltransferase, partial [Planctomycetota bacterium]
MTLTIEQAKEKLAIHHQQHVLKFWNELSPESQTQLLSQVDAIDLDLISTLVQGQDEAHDFGAMANRAEMPPAVAQDGSGAAWSVEEARQVGQDALQQGKIATIVVAGGQGTRLGFDQPKGMFPIGPLSERTLFQVFADILNAIGRRYGIAIPWYVMVSEATKDSTT